jgi:hypothetical protein
MERREKRIGEICKAISRGSCDEVTGVDRREPGAFHQDNGRMTQRLFKGCHFHHRTTVQD